MCEDVLCGRDQECVRTFQEEQLDVWFSHRSQRPRTPSQTVSTPYFTMECVSDGGQMAERVVNQKVAGSIPSTPVDVVSLGKALHPTCLGGRNVPVLSVSRSR